MTSIGLHAYALESVGDCLFLSGDVVIRCRSVFRAHVLTAGPTTVEIYAGDPSSPGGHTQIMPVMPPEHQEFREPPPETGPA